MHKEDGDHKTSKIKFRSIVESLMFLTDTRLDIQYDISLVERFMIDPSILYLKEIKWILRYVIGTTNFGIHYSCSKKLELFGYNDSDCGSNVSILESP